MLQITLASNIKIWQSFTILTLTFVWQWKSIQKGFYSHTGGSLWLWEIRHYDPRWRSTILIPENAMLLMIIYFVRSMLSIQFKEDMPLWSPVISENNRDRSDVSSLEIRHYNPRMVIRLYVPKTVPMIEKCHTPNACSNKRISIWSWGNIDTYVNLKNRQQPENGKNGDTPCCFPVDKIENTAMYNKCVAPRWCLVEMHVKNRLIKTSYTRLLKTPRYSWNTNWCPHFIREQRLLHFVYLTTMSSSLRVFVPQPFIFQTSQHLFYLKQ